VSRDFTENYVLFKHIRAHAENYRRSLAVAFEYRDQLVFALQHYGAISDSEMERIGNNDSDTQEIVRLAVQEADRLNQNVSISHED
jgi:hypothetical protein